MKIIKAGFLRRVASITKRAQDNAVESGDYLKWQKVLSDLYQTLEKFQNELIQDLSQRGYDGPSAMDKARQIVSPSLRGIKLTLELMQYNSVMPKRVGYPQTYERGERSQDWTDTSYPTRITVSE